MHRRDTVFECQEVLLPRAGEWQAWRKSRDWESHRATKPATGVGFPISLTLERSTPCFLLARQQRGVGTWGFMLCDLIPSHSAHRPQAQPGTGHRGSRGGEGKGLQAEPRGEFGLALPLRPQRILSWGLRGACHVAESCVLLVTLAKLLWVSPTAMLGFCFLT